MPKKAFNPIQNLNYSFEGLFAVFRREKNVWIQLSVGFFLVCFNLWLKNYVSATIHFLLTGIILSLEMINSSIEAICDLLHPSEHPQVKYIKDVGSGAVLIIMIIWTTFIMFEIFSWATGTITVV